MSKFYTFIQNNSFGGFHHQPAYGIGYAVIIEADSESNAISRAESVGVYFNGCRDGIDCECCGDRWSRYADEYDTPSIYGEPVGKNAPYEEDGIPSYIHYLDGTIESTGIAKD